jgi:outer membrane receptor protein involved in Fe transport
MGNHRQLRFAVRAALAAAAASAVVPVAMSQTAPATTSTTPSTDASIGEVVVTGTRIQSANLSAVSPITTVTAAAIADTGLTRVEDILNNLPFVFAGENSNVSNGADGTATVDLRGLGPSRTLVLVNGRRLGPGAGDGRSYSDINEIPAALIDHIDILTGGASATYGADAVAGVVNFVMNTHYQGVKVDAGYDFYQHGNSNSSIGATAAIAAGDPTPPSSVDTGFGKNVSVVMGSNFADDRGNATAYLTYDQHAAILQSKYDYSSCTLTGIAGSGGAQKCGGSLTSAKNGAGGYFQAYNYSTSPPTALFTNTVNGKTGAFQPYNRSTDTYNYGPLNYQQVPSTRWTAGTFLDYEINTHATAYAEIMYTNYNSQAQIAPSGDFGELSFIPCSDPLLTAQEKTAICNASAINTAGGTGTTQNVTGFANPVTGANVYIARRNVEGGPRIATFQTDAFRSVVGVRGDIVDGWTYDVYGQRGTVDNSLQNLNYLSNANIINALDVVSNPNGGAPVCVSVLNKTDTACVPWNVWVPNGVTSAATKYLSIPLLIDATVTEYIVEGNVVGDLGTYGVKLPTADEGVKLSIGSEYRSEAAAFQPDEESLLGNAAGSGGPSTAVSGGFTVKEAYAEFTAPLADHVPFADTLALDGGFRYSSYSEGFKTNTFKAGLVWAPVNDVKLRTSFDRAVRAPNIGELYSPQAVGLDGSTDPCAGAAVGQTTPGTGTVNGNTFAQCARTGVSIGQFGHIASNTANQYNGLLGGNPDLKPETADTWSAGLVLQPSFVPGFSASFDYFDIKLTGTVSGVGADNILQNCIQNGSYCNDIHRDQNGSLWKSNDGYVIDTSTNIGSLSTRGIDVKGNYSIPLDGFGKLAFALEGTKLITLDTQSLTGGPSYNCAGYYGVTCGNPNPAWRSVLNTTWTTPWDGLEVNVRWRYFGTVSSQYTSPLAPLTGNNANPSTEHIDAYSWFDLSASFALVDNVRLRLGVNNILDKSPPIVSGGGAYGSDCPTGACNGNTFPGVYDALGRYLFATVSAKF